MVDMPDGAHINVWLLTAEALICIPAERNRQNPCMVRNSSCFMYLCVHMCVYVKGGTCAQAWMAYNVKA